MVAMPDPAGRLGRAKRLGAHALTVACLGLGAALVLPAGVTAQSPIEGPANESVLLSDVRPVSGASRYEQDPGEAPASISIVTREEIRRFGYRTLADVLGSVTGMFTTYDRNYTYLAARGFTVPGDYNTRVLLLLDGHRLNDNVGDAAMIGSEEPVDLSVLDRIEIIRGPASSLYGTNAYYAVVNLVSRDGRDVHGAHLGGDGGSFGSYSGRALMGAGLRGGGDVLAGITGFTSSGQDLRFSEFASPAVGIDGDKAVRGFLKLRRGDWSLEAGGSRRDKTVPTASFATMFGDPREHTTDARAFVVGGFDHRFLDLSRLTVRFSYDRMRYWGAYPYGSGVLFRDTQSGDWLTAEAQYFRTIGRHRLIAGLEARPNLRQDQTAYDEDPFASYLDDHRQTLVWALFAQDEFRVARQVSLTGGLRYDHYPSFGGTLNPRFAAIATVAPATTVKAIAGLAFRAPSAYEQFYQDGSVTQKPNPDLRPETIQSYELVFDRQFGPGAHAGLSLYQFNADHLIRLSTDPADGLAMFANVDQVTSRGVEVEGETRLGNTVVVRGGYAYQRPHGSPDSATPVNAPTHVGRLGVMWTAATDRFSGGLELRGLSGRGTLAGSTVPGYALVNLTVLGRPFRRGPEFSASLYNAFDHRYADPGGQEHRQASIPQDGRSIRLGVWHRF